MDKKSKLIKFGNYLGDLFILQIYFLAYSLRGLIVLGIFPSFLAVVRCLASFFYNRQPDTIKYEFKKTYDENFKKANIIGWISTLGLGLLIFDYNFNKAVLGNGLLRIVLIVLLSLGLIILSHLPISLLRFDLKITETFKQALFLALASPFELVSIILSLVLIELIFVRIPIIIPFLGAPILAAPFAWFSYRSVDKVIAKREGE